MAYQQPPRDPFVLPIEESSQVGEARRMCVALASAIGFNEVARGNVALIATELCTNLVRHARGGELIVRSLQHPCSEADGKDGIELLAIDRGPGLVNLAAAAQDGFSTGGTSGTGLGAVRRLSGEMDLYSQSGRGTVIVARAWNDLSPARPRPHTGAKIMCGVVSLPMPGEDVCGDAWAIQRESEGRIVVLVVDGLGHGPMAFDAARQAVRLFRDGAQLPSHQIIERIHAGMRSTRGAAVAVAEIMMRTHEVHFTGVGNISASLVTAGKSRSMVSQSGTAGVEARRIQTFTYPWADQATLLMHSDGLASRWDVGQYPGLQHKHPAIIAAVLYRDHRRLRDDATALALRILSSASPAADAAAARGRAGEMAGDTVGDMADDTAGEKGNPEERSR